jgi:hypothetical protein
MKWLGIRGDRSGVGTHSGATDYRVEPYDPAQAWVRRIIALVAIVVGGWVCYEAGVRLSGYRHEALVTLRAQLRDVEAQRSTLLSKLAVLQRSSEVESLASEQMRQALMGLEAEVMSLDKQLAFYKNIVAPSTMKPGLRVQDLQLSKAGPDGRYQYKLVLIQVRGDNRLAKGRVEFTVWGRQAERELSLSLADMGAGGPIRFSFKYFQRLDGDLVLPQGFKPSRIEVRVRPQTKRLEPIHRRFAWDKSVVGGGV